MGFGREKGQRNEMGKKKKSNNKARRKGMSNWIRFDPNVLSRLFVKWAIANLERMFNVPWVALLLSLFLVLISKSFAFFFSFLYLFLLII